MLGNSGPEYQSNALCILCVNVYVIGIWEECEGFFFSLCNILNSFFVKPAKLKIERQITCKSNP